MTQPGEHQPTVSAWVITEESPRRALLSFHRKLQSWLQPGGHAEANEDYWQAMVREVGEETGLDLTHLNARELLDDGTWEVRPPDFLQVQRIPPHGGQPEHYHVDAQYVIEVPHQVVQPQDGESSQIGWFTLAELDSLELFTNTRRRLESLLKDEKEAA